MIYERWQYPVICFVQQLTL